MGLTQASTLSALGDFLDDVYYDTVITTRIQDFDACILNVVNDVLAQFDAVAVYTVQ